MKVLGLTGSIGMGKSATLRLFAEAGCAVWDADAAVHRLYAAGGAGAAAVEALFPSAIAPDGSVDRALLSGLVLGDEERLAALEAAVHPLVAADREAFLDEARAAGAKAAVLDIPLLAETGGPSGLDAVIVVTAEESVRRDRVLQRPDMTPEKLDAILRRQAPEEVRLALATRVIRTDGGIEAARADVAAIMADLVDSEG